MSTKELLITDRDKILTAWAKTAVDVSQDVGIIKEWLKTQKHLPEIPSDNMIEFFLTNCKFSIEKTKQNLDMYYTVRHLIPDFYKGINPSIPSEIEIIENSGDCIPLPKLTPTLHRVTIFKYADSPPEKCSLRKLGAHLLINVYEVRLHEDLAMGEVYVVDYTFAKFAVLAQLTPLDLKHCALILEKIHSNRMKELHLLDPPKYVDAIMSVFKSFLSKKLQQRIFVHHTLEDLYKYVPRDLLPTDYGGNEKSMAELRELWKTKFCEYKDRFDILDRMQVKEELRPEKFENDEFLGYHGNFKKIGLD